MKIVKKVLGVSILLGIIFGILYSIETSNLQDHNDMIYDKYQTKIDSLNKEMKNLYYYDEMKRVEKEGEIRMAAVDIDYKYQIEKLDNQYEFSGLFLIVTSFFGLSLVTLFMMLMKYLFFK